MISGITIGPKARRKLIQMLIIHVRDSLPINFSMQLNAIQIFQTLLH